MKENNHIQNRLFERGRLRGSQNNATIWTAKSRVRIELQRDGGEGDDCNDGNGDCEAGNGDDCDGNGDCGEDSDGDDCDVDFDDDE